MGEFEQSGSCGDTAHSRASSGDVDSTYLRLCPVPRIIQTITAILDESSLFWISEIDRSSSFRANITEESARLDGVWPRFQVSRHAYGEAAGTGDGPES
jgi:hypothetical protein